MRSVIISKGRCPLFGNGGNDIEMLLATGIGVAMGNAMGTVKAVVREVCGNCADDGFMNSAIDID